MLGETVLVGPDFGPAAVGVCTPGIVLPDWSLELPVDELDLILRHEHEHIRAGDQRLLLAGLVAVVVMP